MATSRQIVRLSWNNPKSPTNYTFIGWCHYNFNFSQISVLAAKEGISGLSSRSTPISETVIHLDEGHPHRTWIFLWFVKDGSFAGVAPPSSELFPFFQGTNKSDQRQTDRHQIFLSPKSNSQWSVVERRGLVIDVQNASQGLVKTPSQGMVYLWSSHSGLPLLVASRWKVCVQVSFPT